LAACTTFIHSNPNALRVKIIKLVMEKLIVKNFGPIKEAEIDLTKYVVFIGDTSTGKSVLAKLISIFRDFTTILNNNSDDFDKDLDFDYHLKNYNIDFNIDETIISYSDENFEFLFQHKILTLIKDIKTVIPAYSPFENRFPIYSNLRIKLNSSSVYFPAERILTSLIGNTLSGLWANNVALPNCFKIFSANYEVARKEILTGDYSLFGFEYKYENGDDKIISSSENFQLSKASSGIQSLLPLLLVFDYEIKNSIYNPNLSILIEEPELNLFPKKQKVLIDYIFEKINKTSLKLIITTHSPYVLSSIDTLMLAKNTYNEHKDLKEEINAIVSENKWVDYENISVYEVRNDGKVYSIKNEEFRSIDTNAIDDVSDIISEEFDKLTELRYAH
ncbi:MAG: AAA family ATPase, partial [Flavobacterium sp.]